MGAGCSNKRDNSIVKEESPIKSPRKLAAKNSNTLLTKRSPMAMYSDFEFINTSSSSNIIVYTSLNNYSSEFTVREATKKESSVTHTHKIQGGAVGYYKGYKLDANNQDKFFVLVNGTVEIYCVLDGHGPYGNIVAQIVQDLLFKELSSSKIFSEDFEVDYEKILENIFANVQAALIKRDNIKYIQDFDLLLSGTAVSVVIKKGDALYCANVGNVLALLFFAEKIYSYKFNFKELSLNNSAFSVEKDTLDPVEVKISPNNISNNGGFYHTQKTYMISDNSGEKLHKNFDVDDELRRIYEYGGEIRMLAGENKFRIFLKGKYYPGLINTRSLGDEIGSSIGISNTPHISRYLFEEKNKYYLLMCTDGISNVLKHETIINIIENNDVCKK